MCVCVYIYVLVIVLFCVLVIVLFCVLFVFVLFCVLFVCKCVLYCCHQLSAPLQLTNISYIILVFCLHEMCRMSGVAESPSGPPPKGLFFFSLIY